MEKSKGSKVISKSLGTHDGVFHADEVTACALLILFGLIDENNIFRSRELNVLNHCEFVCDVAGEYDEDRKKFDHHQADYEGPLSSAGMILLYLKNQKILSQKEYDLFNDALIIGVDAHDNGKHKQIHGNCLFSDVVDNFNPISYEATPKERDQAFHEALQFVLGHLERFWNRYKDRQQCRQIVEDCMRNSKECLMFDEAIPWLDLFFELGGEFHSAVFVVMPSGDHWKLRGIPPSSDNKMAVRVPQPKEWAGRLESELKQISGIPGAIFCHKQQFISVWETKQDALKAMEYVLENHKNLIAKGT